MMIANQYGSTFESFQNLFFQILFVQIKTHFTDVLWVMQIQVKE